ncbi:cupin domain-containing protein [Paenibacillus gansuensis]|uniref:Cupin domain-containing protein n=1 Tax=Paenibacillus gansuensis TaxID=306542 RepID=A0ABW5PG79_9BACL
MPEILDVLGPRIQHLTELANNQDYCVMKGEVGPGVIVPVHSHADRETFYVISGELEAWSGDRWITLRAGDILDIPENEKHAWRNLSNENVTLLITTTVKMGEFFSEVGRPAASVPPGPPQPAALQKFVEVAMNYGYWLGTPEDNATIGLKLG